MLFHNQNEVTVNLFLATTVKSAVMSTTVLAIYRDLKQQSKDTFTNNVPLKKIAAPKILKTAAAKLLTK